MYNLPQILFITGIGTNIGKSYATGWLASEINKNGESVITQKLIQTGNTNVSEDIEVHRQLMGIPMQECDTNHTTAPIILSYPASPHLAARIDNVTLDYTLADQSTTILTKNFDYVLIEGAGGLMVPLTETYLTVDYIKDRSLATVVVTNGELGSISDTILTIEALQHRSITIAAIIYNPHFDKDAIIAEDTLNYIRSWVMKNCPNSLFLVMSNNLYKNG